METKTFSLGAVLTVTTDIFLLEDIGELYEILDHMTGDSLYTHQLPRAGEACKGPLLAQFPHLQGIEVPKLNSREAYMQWLSDQEQVLGSRFPVEPLESWQHKDPLAEVAEMTDAPIIPVIIELRWSGE
jgi:hypothetical protein